MADAKVLLVDADAWNPTSSRTFVPEATFGLQDALAGNATLEQCVWQMANLGFGPGRLEILPVGSAGPSASLSDLLDSQIMRALLDNLAEAYDTVVFDLSPARSVVDSLVLGGFLQGVVLAAVEHETPLPDLLEVTHDLRSAGATVLGVVLTKEIRVSMIAMATRASYRIAQCVRQHETEQLPALSFIKSGGLLLPQSK
jgi:Mrp family chromosome partitioning ATPase